MYMNSINSNNTDYTLSSFGNIFISNDATADPKTVIFPNGYNLDSNLAFKVVFTNGHAVDNDTANMTLNDIPVVVNKYGTLIPIPNHKLSTASTIYSTLQANTVLEMYYTSNYDGNNNPAFVVVGNPVVLSSIDYTIYADGKVGDDLIGTIKPWSLAEVPYGWHDCDHSPISRTTYSELFDLFRTQTYDGTPSHTLLSRYGIGDGSTTFNLPDYRECALVGVGSNGTFITQSTQNHETHTLGQFKDDCFQNHKHYVSSVGYYYDSGGTSLRNTLGASEHANQQYDNHTITVDIGGAINLNNTVRTGSVTHGKQIGIKYIIKVL